MGTRRKLFPQIDSPENTGRNIMRSPSSNSALSTTNSKDGPSISSVSSSSAEKDNENKHHKSTALRLIQWIESQKVPKCCLEKLIKRTNQQQEQQYKQQLRQQEQVPEHDNDSIVYLITGIERVLYGTQPAAEVVKIVGVHPPRYLCYMVSGFVCDIIQFVIDFVLYIQLQDASLCWALSFGMSIVFRHTTHRYLVFGDYVGGYWKSLGRMYAGYSIIIVLSTLFNIAMTKYIKVPHAFAWIITLLWTGIVNYFILKKLWTFGGRKDKNNDLRGLLDEKEMTPLEPRENPQQDIEMA